MLKHYFKIAFRNLAKQKGLTLINMAGLSIGLACFLLFLLYAINEFSFDRFHKKAKDTYRVYAWYEAVNGQEAGASTYLPMPLGPALKQDFPEVEHYVRMRESWTPSFIRVEGKVNREDVSYADPQVLDV